MKSATVKQRRTAPDGSRMVNVCCPACSHRHWITYTDQPVFCPLRKDKMFRIAAGR